MLQTIRESVQQHGYPPSMREIADAVGLASTGAVSTCPLVGRIAAGSPVLADEAIDEVYPLPRQLVGDGIVFLLRVTGNPMAGAAIADGDQIVVRQQGEAESGDIVAAMIDGEATVRTLRR